MELCVPPEKAVAKVLWAKYVSTLGPKAHRVDISQLWRSIVAGTEAIIQAVNNEPSWSLAAITDEVVELYGLLTDSTSSADLVP